MRETDYTGYWTEFGSLSSCDENIYFTVWFRRLLDMTAPS